MEVSGITTSASPLHPLTCVTIGRVVPESVFISLRDIRGQGVWSMIVTGAGTSVTQWLPIAHCFSDPTALGATATGCCGNGGGD